MKQRLEPIVFAELDAIGLALVELRIGGSRNRPVLDVRIDRRDLGDVKIEDCERASRVIEARLDAAPELINGRYVLEVSSPGLERAVRSLADWRRFVGRRVSVKSPRFGAIGGWIEAEIVAVQGDDAEARIVVREGQGAEIVLEPAEVHEARLAFNWKP